MAPNASAIVAFRPSIQAPIDNDPAVVACDAVDDAALEAFSLAVSKHRNFTREVLAQPV